MKILVLSTAYPWRGGIAHYIALLAGHLQKNHRVDIVTFSRQYPLFLFPGKTQKESGDPGIVLQTESLVDSINPVNWILTGWKLRKRNYDVVVFKYWLPFFGPCFGTICRLIKWRKKTKVIALCDNVLPHEHRPGDSIFTKYAFHIVDGYVVQSESVEQDLLSFVKNPSYKRVMHPIYENFGASISKIEARKALGFKENDRIILFFGYIRKYKGLELLLEAMKTIKKSMDIHLLVAGEFYDDELHYRDYVKINDLNNCVHFISEYIPNDRVPYIFSAADCVVLPYRSATQSGIVQIAYNFNKPVIVTDVGGLAETVSDGISGFVVRPGSPEALAGSIEAFYREKKEASFVEGVIKEKAKYSWDTLVKAIEALAAKS